MLDAMIVPSPTLWRAVTALVRKERHQPQVILRVPRWPKVLFVTITLVTCHVMSRSAVFSTVIPAATPSLPKSACNRGRLWLKFVRNPWTRDYASWVVLEDNKLSLN
jgi:hypothetical protein